MKRIVLTVTASIGIGSSLPAGAQPMKYGALEEMFGEPVTLSASGAPQKASQAPVNMEIITADEIRRSGADTIPDILRHYVGIEVRHYGATDMDVGIRGYDAPNSSRVLVLLNGRQVYIDFHSYTAWATLPVRLEEIRQIEIVKGPNSALFGFNAVAGVINIVTFDPIFDPVDIATARYGTEGGQELGAVATARLDAVGLRLSASEKGEHEAGTGNLPPSDGPYNTRDFSRSVYGHLRAELPAGLNLSAEIDAENVKQFEMTVGGYPGWVTYRADREKIGLGGDSPVGYLDLDFYRNFVSFDYLIGENCPSCTTINNTLYVVQLSDLLKPAAGHILRLGAEYRSNRVDGSAYDADQLGLDIYAADALWIWQITPDLSLTNSARFDHAAYSFSGPVNSALLYGAQDYNRAPISELSYNSAIVYALTGLDQLRLTTARGAQIPDFYSSFPQPLNSVPYYVAGAVDAFEGSPKVKPSLITNYEADWDRAVPALLSKGRLALFYQVSRDVIGLPGDVPANNFPNAALAAITGDQGVIGYAGNLGRSESWGTELSLKGASGDWRWTAGYAAAFIRDHFPTNVSLASPDSSTDYQHGNPRHAAIAALGRSWERWEADLFGRWRSSFDDITIGSSAASYTAYHIKSNVTLDGRLAYRPIDALTLAVSGEQLNRAGLQTSSGTLSERRVFGTVSVKF